MSKCFRRGQVVGLFMLLMSFSSCAYHGGYGGYGVSGCEPNGCEPAGCGVKGCPIGGCYVGACKEKICSGIVCPLGDCYHKRCGVGACGGCGVDQCGECGVGACGGCGVAGCGGCGVGGCCVGNCLTQCQLCEHCCARFTGWACRKPNAVPQTLPLGSTVRAHDQAMQTNAEAADFIFHRHDFVAQTAHLTPDAKDKIVEVAARLRSTPFPVLIERSENNSNPELDALRRKIVAQILFDFGNVDAQQRTIVATPYGPGYTGRRAESMYFQHVGFGNNTNNNNNNGGGFGGGGFNGGF